jgi:hypothetical protein
MQNEILSEIESNLVDMHLKDLYLAKALPDRYVKWYLSKEDGSVYFQGSDFYVDPEDLRSNHDYQIFTVGPAALQKNPKVKKMDLSDMSEEEFVAKVFSEDLKRTERLLLVLQEKGADEKDYSSDDKER